MKARSSSTLAVILSMDKDEARWLKTLLTYAPLTKEKREKRYQQMFWEELSMEGIRAKGEEKLNTKKSKLKKKSLDN